MPRSNFVYVTYIRTTPERLWAALTEDVEFMKQYWFGVHCESQWTAGSPWKMVHPDGRILDAGQIVEADPPRRLVIRWQHQNRPELKAEGDSLCTMELEPFGTAVKLTITHTIEHEPSKLIEAVSGGWPKIICNLKSLLETGATVLNDPYPVQSAHSGKGQ
jgi:uncharacterized protein YndB with AHSA1/START domain